MLRRYGYSDRGNLLGVDRVLVGFKGCTIERDHKTGERKVYLTFNNHHSKLFRSEVSQLFLERQPQEVIIGSHKRYKKKKRHKKLKRQKVAMLQG